MGKKDYRFGSVGIPDLVAFMQERQNIFEKKERGDPFPWTEDPILSVWKFTNIYRQNDRGTRVLTAMLEGKEPDSLMFWNIVWYRMFNWREHTRFFNDPNELREYMQRKYSGGDQVFTNAHMTAGIAVNGSKLEAFLQLMDQIWVRKDQLLGILLKTKRLGALFCELTEFRGIGKFIAYEIVTDCRHRWTVTDFNSWANIGPGCKRGMERLGIYPDLDNLRKIMTEVSKSIPVELRDVEHSLCEFDKYMRVKTGAGKPRMRYHASDSHR